MSKGSSHFDGDREIGQTSAIDLTMHSRRGLYISKFFMDRRNIVSSISTVVLFVFLYGLLFEVSISGNNGGKSIVRRVRNVRLGFEPVMQNVPKVAYLLWDAGWEYAPEMQQMCLNSFRRENINITVNPLSLVEAEYLIDRPRFYRDKAWNEATIQAKSDIIRVELLSRFGGIWADASVYLNQPLLSWLNDSMLQAGFLAYERRDPKVNETTKPWIAPWFLVAEKESEIMMLWRDEVRKAWRNDPIPAVTLGYFWVHRLFQQLVLSNKRFKELYDKMPFMDADVPHCWASRWLEPPLYKIKAPGCCEIKTLKLKEERQRAMKEKAKMLDDKEDI